MKQERPKLQLYERLIALFLLCFIASIIVKNLLISDSPTSVITGTPFYINSPLVEVKIQGDVRNPGVYQVKKGTLVRNAIKLARPNSSANLDKMNLENEITRRRTITIKKRGG